MGIPQLNNDELATALQGGAVTAKRVTKFLRLCPDSDRQLEVVLMLPEPQKSEWATAFGISLPDQGD